MVRQESEHDPIGVSDWQVRLTSTQGDKSVGFVRETVIRSKGLRHRDGRAVRADKDQGVRGE